MIRNNGSYTVMLDIIFLISMRCGRYMEKVLQSLGLKDYIAGLLFVVTIVGLYYSLENENTELKNELSHWKGRVTTIEKKLEAQLKERNAESKHISSALAEINVKLGILMGKAEL